MTRVAWTRPALAHLREIAEYITRDSPRAARTVVQSIRIHATALTDHPFLGRRGRVEGTRELVIARLPYIVAYRVRGDFIDILAVIHTSRRWPEQIP